MLCSLQSWNPRSGSHIAGRQSMFGYKASTHTLGISKALNTDTWLFFSLAYFHLYFCFRTTVSNTSAFSTCPAAGLIYTGEWEKASVQWYMSTTLHIECCKPSLLRCSPHAHTASYGKLGEVCEQDYCKSVRVLSNGTILLQGTCGVMPRSSCTCKFWCYEHLFLPHWVGSLSDLRVQIIL